MGSCVLIKPLFAVIPPSPPVTKEDQQCIFFRPCPRKSKKGHRDRMRSTFAILYSNLYVFSDALTILYAPKRIQWCYLTESLTSFCQKGTKVKKTERLSFGGNWVQNIFLYHVRIINWSDKDIVKISCSYTEVCHSLIMLWFLKLTNLLF